MRIDKFNNRLHRQITAVQLVLRCVHSNRCDRIGHCIDELERADLMNTTYLMTSVKMQNLVK